MQDDDGAGHQDDDGLTDRPRSKRAASKSSGVLTL
jgi:hypothetical protein